MDEKSSNLTKGKKSYRPAKLDNPREMSLQTQHGQCFAVLLLLGYTQIRTLIFWLVGMPNSRSSEGGLTHAKLSIILLYNFVSMSLLLFLIKFTIKILKLKKKTAFQATRETWNLTTTITVVTVNFLSETMKS